jgi:WD40 repeat protein
MQSRSRLSLVGLIALAMLSGQRNVTAAVDAHGDPLPDRARARIGTTRFRHGDAVTAIAYAPDGRNVATASRDSTLRLWEVESGKELACFMGHRGAVLAAIFIRDGKTLISGGTDGTVRLWRLTPRGEEVRRFQVSKEEVQTFAIAGNGSLVATGTEDGAIILYDLAKGKELHHLHQEGQVYCLALSADGKRLAVNRAASGIALWDTTKGEPLHLLGEGVVASLAFAPDGHTLVVGYHDNRILLWDVRSGKEIRSFAGHERQPRGQFNGVLSVCFSTNGRRLASGGTDNVARIWDVETGRPIREAKGHRNWVTAVAFSLDGKHLLTGGVDNTVRHWDAVTGREISPKHEPESAVTTVSLAAYGRTLVTMQAPDRLARWDATTGRERRLPEAIQSGRAAAFAPDGKTLAVAGTNGLLQLCDLATGKVRRLDNESPRPMDRLVWDAAGKRLASYGPDYHVDAWDCVKGELLQHVGLREAAAPGMSFDRSGRLLATASLANEIRIWDRATGLEKQQIAGKFGGTLAFSFAADGRSLHVAGADGHVRLWELFTGKLRRKFGTKASSLAAAAFTDDGRFLATGDADGTIRLWDTVDAKELQVLQGHHGSITSLAFAARSPTLASSSRDTTALVWDLSDLLRTHTPAPLDLPACEIDALWKQLAGDAPDAFQAMRALRRAPGQTVPYLRAKLRPVRLEMDRMLADLDSDSYPVRVEAARQLAQCGRVAEKTLRRALANKPSLEVRRRVEELLAAMPNGPDVVVATPRQIRCVELLEDLGSDDAIRLLRTLAGGIGEAELTQQAKSALARKTK